jgi:hypothetical protein
MKHYLYAYWFALTVTYLTVIEFYILTLSYPKEEPRPDPFVVVVVDKSPSSSSCNLDKAFLFFFRWYLSAIIRVVQEIQTKRAHIAIQEQDKSKQKVKALLTPLHLVPKSLHPWESLAH